MRIKESSSTAIELRSGDQLTPPLVSIITPAYNSEKYISSVIDSVLAQTYSNWELLIIVDAKSKDRTSEIATKASQQDSRIKVVLDPECNSLSANRNKGLDLAQGLYIAFLDSDDRWLPSKLSTQVQEMQNGQLQISYHSFAVIDEEGHTCGPNRQAKYDVSYHDLLKNNCIGCLTVMAHRDFIKNKRMHEVRHEDLHFWLQLLEDGGTAKPIQIPLAEYRIRKNSVSENKIQCAIWRWQLYRKLNLPFYKRAYYMTLYIFFAVYKRI
nr:glycosyltransferase family 2 protein [Bdellovibrio sp. HAGR004]